MPVGKEKTLSWEGKSWGIWGKFQIFLATFAAKKSFNKIQAHTGGLSQMANPWVLGSEFWPWPIHNTHSNRSRNMVRVRVKSMMLKRSGRNGGMVNLQRLQTI